jgi:hypothetical protein
MQTALKEILNDTVKNKTEGEFWVNAYKKSRPEATSK